MKRKYILFLLSLITLSFVIVSCRKDLSTMDVNKIPGIEIDTTGNGQLNVYQFDRLKLEPVLEMGGVKEADLSYSWKINHIPGDTAFFLLSNTRNLDEEIKLKPNTAGKFHNLLYTVTDNKNGLDYTMTWHLTVLNNIGEGLVVAETTEDGQSDLSHIMSPRVTSNYTGESVKRHVYSTLNGNTIDGKIKQIRFATIFGVQALLAITDNSIVRINTLDYTFGGKNDDLFYGGSDEYHSQALAEAYQANIYIANNKLTATYLGANKQFSLPVDSRFVVPDIVALNPFSANSDHLDDYTPPVVLNYYEEVEGHFVYQPTFSTFGDRVMHKAPDAPAAAFDPANMPGFENLGAGITVVSGFLHVLRNKSTGKINMYLFDGGVDDYPYIIAPAPRAVHDLSAAPEIANAVSFLVLDDQKVVYYATDTKIYAILYSTSTPVFELRYTVPAGEKITTLDIYRQVGYPYMSSYIATNNRQLVMSTYGTEGKVYLLPMINPGLGNIDNANIKTFGGFGRITAIAPQK